MDPTIKGKLTEKVLTNTIAEVNKAIGNVIDDSVSDISDDLSRELVLSMLNEPVDFIIKDNGELTVEIDGEEHVIDPKTQDKELIADQFSKVVKAMPVIPWDIYCNGIRRKQNEAVAAFKVIIVNGALNGLYEERINELIRSYDFENFRANDSTSETFVDILSIIEQDAGSVIKFLLSCCAIKITAKKTKEEKPYVGILPEGDDTFIRYVSEQIAIIEADASKKVEAEKDRASRLLIIKDKEKRITEFVADAVGGDERKDVILKISRLTPDSLPSKVRVVVRETVRRNVRKLVEDGSISDPDLASDIIKKVSRRALKQAVKTSQRQKFMMVMDAESDISNILPKS